MSAESRELRFRWHLFALTRVSQLWSLNSALHPIRPRRHDQPLDVLRVPVRYDHFIGKPIEQLRMRGLRSAQAEVVRRRDEARSVMPLPEPIHPHASRQWMTRIGQPVGEVEPRSPVAWRQEHRTRIGRRCVAGGCSRFGRVARARRFLSRSDKATFEDRRHSRRHNRPDVVNVTTNLEPTTLTRQSLATEWERIEAKARQHVESMWAPNVCGMRGELFSISAIFFFVSS